ncbi:MAG: hypothetical protein GYA24_12950 [Candidatus Lokiarchaeota archaeon]|nr:hypothetical protein [Candidatus Lokiarchaeota archaeon]
MNWCDFSCKHASIDSTGDLTGACRREIVVRCSKHGKLVKKNGPCLDDIQERLKNDPEYQRRFRPRDVD